MTFNQVPYTDFNRYIKKYLKEKWQLQWNNSNSKLHRIKPIIEPWPNLSNRRESVILTRLRIGHTRISHGYLMTRGRPPECCGTELTVEHFMIKCKKYEDLRKKYGLPEDLTVLLGPECPKEKIIAYLTETSLINEI